LLQSDRQILIEIINWPIIEERRDGLVEEMKVSLEAYRKGESRQICRQVS